jgi:hypothetical protein
VRTDAGAAAIAGPFIAQTRARGLRAPVRLLDQDARGWPLAERHGDVLICDQFADLWWARRVLGSDYRVVRPCWPEEAGTMIDDIRASVMRILA